jgi:hypothetical protein
MPSRIGKASRQGLHSQFRLCLAVFEIGLADRADENIKQACVHGVSPELSRTDRLPDRVVNNVITASTGRTQASPVTSACAFYRIFLGHQQDAVAGKGKIGGADRDGDRERDALRTSSPRACNCRKKRWGSPIPAIAYSLRPCRSATAQRRCSPLAATKALADQAHVELRQVASRVHHPALRRAVPHHGVHTRQTPQGLTQGAGRQQPAVAGAASVKNHQFDRALQAIVLQAVVGDDHVTVGVSRQQAPARRQGGRGRRRPARRCAWPATGVHRRPAKTVRTRPPAAPARTTAVAATDDSWPPALLAQAAHQPQHQRCLATATDGQVADHDHRHRQAI